LPPTDAANIPFEGVIAYALGWYMSSYKSHLVYFHAGEIDGYGAFVMLVPSLHLGVSLLSNGQRAHSVLKGLSVGLIDALLGDSGDKALEKVEQAFLDSNKEQAEKASTARQRLYPDAPSTPTIPLALDVKKYAGSYRNIAYGPLTLELIEQRDEAGGTQFGSTTYLVSRTGQHHSLSRTSTFTHINAENWLVSRFETGIEVVNPDLCPSKTALKAQTRVNAKAEVVSTRFEMIVPKFRILGTGYPVRSHYSNLTFYRRQ
jgi:hypothetical protein